MTDKKKILLVEDEQDLVDSLTLRLTSNDYEVLTALNGADGLNKARALSPALIIMDVRLPKMDGFTVCRMLKYDEKYAAIPIIMLTARVQPQDKLQGKEAGADLYLTKPFKSEELLASIKGLLAGR